MMPTRFGRADKMDLLTLDILGIILGHVDLRPGEGEGTLLDMWACGSCEHSHIQCIHLNNDEVRGAADFRLVCKKWDQAVRRRFSYYVHFAA